MKRSAWSLLVAVAMAAGCGSEGVDGGDTTESTVEGVWSFETRNTNQCPMPSPDFVSIHIAPVELSDGSTLWVVDEPGYRTIGARVGGDSFVATFSIPFQPEAGLSGGVLTVWGTDDGTTAEVDLEYVDADDCESSPFENAFQRERW